MRLSSLGTSEKARPARWALGVLVAMVVVGAAALAGSVVAKQSPDAGAAAGALDKTYMTYRISIDGVFGENRSNWIDVESWSWGESQSGSSSGGGGGGAGKVSMTDFVFTKEMDKTSTQLMLACASGKHIKEATLEMHFIDAKGKDTVYMTVKFSDILISSYQTGGSSGDPIPTESISFNFEKIHWTYSGPGAESGDQWGWDLSENQQA